MLGAKQKKLLAATKSALAAQEKADRALSTALTNVAGGKNAREQVAALNSLLPGIDVHLSAARKASSAATAQFVKDTEAAMKAPKNANTRAIAKAEASGVKADQAAKTLEQLGAAKAAVLSAIGTKEGSALEEARAAKVPGAQDVVDVMDLASKSTKEQVRLVGAGTILLEVMAAARLLRHDFGIEAEVWSATSFTELAREAREVQRANRLHPTAAPQMSHVQRCLDGAWPVVAATDYVRAVPQLVAEYLAAPYTTLGTDGFGRSDTRVALRRFFEVGRHNVVLAALHALAAAGAVAAAVPAAAIARYGLDTTSPAPWTL